ncbi:NeuD/PglB/VioB family sugar acetyltransferase [Streptomyces roseicoloratus]|uniref:NeuD/PglB/VioB family sugar acetyltransferase n=1 Tax=Streptomyces roseicoloratus TaxID=2508722 RepID=A0ABY9S1C0_9ACTN|nr:NeuD/PglB/VioB family sugar acetyltransferase [Streptomyces roseicoloratus]WMX48213.1 NeuD/PglB/VioB family sugar acetyltransferase [Streptomyces roseicoloratus]
MGKKIDGVPVLGGTDRARELRDVSFVVCVGNPRDPASRARLVGRLGLPERRYTTVVHPTALVSDTSSIGPGTVLLAHTVLTASVRVGRHVAVMPQTVLTHDDEIGDFATLASGVRIGGASRIGRGVYLGAGALVRENTAIGDWSLIGMGAVVLGNVPPGEVWVGNPATRLREAPPPSLEQLEADGEKPAEPADAPSGPAEASSDATEAGSEPAGARGERD